jgi:hypothetical protein
MKFKSWVKNFKEEVERIRLGLIGRYPCGRNEKETCRIINLDVAIYRDRTLANIRGKSSMVNYCEIRVGCRKKM